MGVGLLMSVQGASADQTTGGINWLDPAGYQKPMFVSIAVPNEASAPKYYVDLGSGSGTSCTQAAPCALASVAGKPGTSGGPAYIYIRGTGGINIFNPSSSFFGSAGSELVIKPWPAGTTGCASGCTATITSSSVNNITGSNVHHWIFDGGPNMGIILQTTSAGDNKALRINSNNHTVYRVQGRCNPSDQGGNTILMVSEGEASGLRVINSEFYGCLSGASSSQQSALYLGGSSCGDGGSGYDNVLWQNNIVRNMGGEGLELNPRSVSTGATITGSAFHDIGKQTCGPSWDCRPAVTIDNCITGSASNINITNNLMWDLGSSCVWTKGAGTGRTFSNNTCYDYGKGTGNGACQQGFCGGTPATIKNNIIFAPAGTNPFDGTSFTASNNVCGSGESCGTSSKVWSSSAVMSLLATELNFLKITSSSVAAAAGVNLFASGVTTDYAGLARSSTGAFDIGAFMVSGGTGTVLSAPTGLRIIR
jgi:hypothetical protein